MSCMAPISPTATKKENMGRSRAASAAAAAREGGPRPSSSGDSAAHSTASSGLTTDTHRNTCATDIAIQFSINSSQRRDLDSTTRH